MENKTILITGGLGFIGAHFVHLILNKFPTARVIVLDKNTYAANYSRIKLFLQNPLFFYVEGDIANQALVKDVFTTHKPEYVVNFAAESHVDNSIQNPGIFLDTNVKGTYNLLEIARQCWMNSPHQLKTEFKSARFYQISTDEVFGTLTETGKFNEESPYAPNSPYSASKAAADHWVRSYHHTFGMPTLVSYCSNNYGPYQHDEKLIPTIIRNALKGNSIPIYGDGNNIRDWLYVEDHIEAILMILTKAEAGQTYAIGGKEERSNIQLCNIILDYLEKHNPRHDRRAYVEQINFVDDRPGHDFRYAIDAKKIQNQIGWEPKHSFEEAIQKTIVHYIEKYKNLS